MLTLKNKKGCFTPVCTAKNSNKGLPVFEENKD